MSMKLHNKNLCKLNSQYEKYLNLNLIKNTNNKYIEKNIILHNINILSTFKILTKTYEQ